jgi:hypothetical protein
VKFYYLDRKCVFWKIVQIHCNLDITGMHTQKVYDGDWYVNTVISFKDIPIVLLFETMIWRCAVYGKQDRNDLSELKIYIKPNTCGRRYKISYVKLNVYLLLTCTNGLCIVCYFWCPRIGTSCTDRGPT